MKKIDRLTNEILLLQKRERGARELAELLEVSKRTIIRDIQVLCEMGVPIIAREGIYGGYALAGEYTIQPLQLTWKEMFLLMMALEGISKLADSPFAGNRTSLMTKLQALLPPQHRERVENLLAKLAIEVPGRPHRFPMLEKLVAHLESDTWLRIEYRTTSGVSGKTIKPLRVYADRGFWYLQAHAEDRERSFRVDRIEGIEECPPEAGFKEPLPYNHPSHPLVRVTLSAEGIRRVETDPNMAPHVFNAEPPLTLEFHCPPSELDWYARYFGPMGSDAIVSDPPELIAGIRAQAEKILGIYKKSSER